jgi:hypothetical protein
LTSHRVQPDTSAATGVTSEPFGPTHRAELRAAEGGALFKTGDRRLIALDLP